MGDDPLDRPTAGPDPVDEARLIVALRDLVDDEHPSQAVRGRVLDGLESGAPPRPSVPVGPIAAALVVAVIAVAALVNHQGGGNARLTADQSAVTTPTSSEPASTVASDSTTTSTDSPQATTTTETTGTTLGTADGPTPTVTEPPSPSCRNSTDPACGAFHWDPVPVNRPAVLTAALPAGPIVVGRSYELTLEMFDPDGPVDLACYSVDADGPALALGSCTVESRSACPDRHGPWTPPPGSRGEARTVTQIEFQRAGTYMVEVIADAAQGCDNVDPYRSAAATRITVEVGEASEED